MLLGENILTLSLRVFRRKRLMSFDLDDRAFRSGCLLLFTSCCQLECRQQDEE